MTKKAQMEMIGLAIVVILVALGMFLYAEFSITPKTSSSQSQSFQQNQLATNFVNALLNSEANCVGSSATFSDVLYGIEQPAANTLQCGSGDLTSYFNDTVSSLLNQTLSTWGYHYEFTVILPNFTSPVINISNSCVGGQVDFAEYPLPGYTGNILVRLKICS